MEYICPICYGCCLLKNKSRHVKTKRHIQALNNKKMINNTFTYSVEPMQSNNHNVSDVDSSVENQSKLNVSCGNRNKYYRSRFSPDSKFYNTMNNHNIDSCKN